MVTPVILLRQGKKKELWLTFCSFIDLSIDQFMGIQNRLLLEQIELLNGSAIGAKIMGRAKPRSVDEFRRQVPLTTYADYCPDLQERRDYVLPAKASRWVRTSGYSGTYDVKWIPWSERFTKECESVSVACSLFSISRYRGDVSKVGEHWKVLYTVGGPEYASGTVAEITQRAFNFDFMPSNAEGLPFEERIRAGFADALDKGLDAFGGLPSVLVAVGDQMREQHAKIDLKFLIGHPKAMLRLTKGLLTSKIAGRTMLPRDLWNIKSIIGGGTDSAVFKKKVEIMWGAKPMELYAGTEGGIYAMQTWDYAGMTFVPNLNFLEFIPEDEHYRWRFDHSYQPRTVLLDEVRPDRNYEIVITNLHGGALVRFRLGDMIRIVSLRNEYCDIDLPQMIFYGRADYVIDIAGLGRLTERIIWEALENTGVAYAEWTARKEVRSDRAVLHLYVEPTPRTSIPAREIAELFSRELRKLEKRYHHNPYNIYDADAKPDADSQQVEVTFLPHTAFAKYVAQRQAEGADLGHLKPPHVNPSDKALSLLGIGPPQPAVVGSANGDR